MPLVCRIACAGTPRSRSKPPVGADAAQSRGVDAVFSVVGRDYARTLGLPMLRGRDFTNAELVPGPVERVAIIDDVVAERLWPEEDALGRLIQFRDPRLFLDEDDQPRNSDPTRTEAVLHRCAVHPRSHQ